MKEIKVGTKVRVKNLDKHYEDYEINLDCSGEMKEESGKIHTISSVYGRGYRLEGNGFTWSDDTFDVIDEFEIGDIVVLDEDASVKDVIEAMNGNSGDTMQLLNEIEFTEMKVISTSSNHVNVDVESDLIGDLLVSKSLLKLVSREEKKEMTISELEKELGYKIKVIGNEV